MRTVVEIIGRFDSLSNGSKSFAKAIDIKEKKVFTYSALFYTFTCNVPARRLQLKFSLCDVLICGTISNKK